jgi:hypothetical protein
VARRRPWRRWSAASFLAHELAEKNKKKGEEFWRRRGRRLGFAGNLVGIKREGKVEVGLNEVGHGWLTRGSCSPAQYDIEVKVGRTKKYVGSWRKNGLLAELLFFIGLSSDCNSLSFSFLAAYFK